MTDEVYTIGEEQGLRIELDALIDVLDRESKARLEPKDRELAETQLRSVLGASMAAAPPKPRVRRRVGDGKYLAVGALGRLGLAVILGPLLHLVATGTALSSARRMLKVDQDWRPKIVAIYARLDGLDRDVFEAINEAHNEWLIVN